MIMLYPMYMYRRNFKELLGVVLYDDSSTDDSSSSDEDELDILFVEVAFAPKLNLRMRINLEDIADIGCEQMFR